MYVLLLGMSTFSSFIKFIVLLIVFILILAASYYFTKWYAKAGFIKNTTSNIEVFETFPMGPGRQICIVRIGEKYLALAITKENITYLTDIEANSLIMPEVSSKENGAMPQDFQVILKEMLQKKRKKK